MKANLKDNWVPKWREGKPEGWKHPQLTKNPLETNHQRVARQREMRRRYLESIKVVEAENEQRIQG